MILESLEAISDPFLARREQAEDARIFIKDRIEKDVVAPAYNDGFNDAKRWEKAHDPDHLNPAEGGNRASDDYW